MAGKHRQAGTVLSKSLSRVGNSCLTKLLELLCKQPMADSLKQPLGKEKMESDKKKKPHNRSSWKRPLGEEGKA